VKKRNKIFLVKSYNSIVVLLILLIILLNVSKEFLHNHGSDFFKHKECPVLILNNLLSSGITVHFEFPVEHFVELSFGKLQNISLVESEFIIFFLRSPPLI